MELFEDLAPVMAPLQEEEKEVKGVYSRKKPRRWFGGRNQNQDHDDGSGGGCVSSQKDGRAGAPIFVYEYVRNKYVDPANKDAGVLMGELPAHVSGTRTASAQMLAQIVINK